jgi:hypothetical protein
MSPLHRLVAALRHVVALPAHSRTARDLMAVALVSILAFILFGLFDVNEQLMRWLLSHRELRLHELPLAVLVAALGLGWFAVRRWREYRAELQRRRALEP